MKAQTLHIEKPSKELLEFFRKLRAEKEEHKAKLIAKKETYFPKSKQFLVLNLELEVPFETDEGYQYIVSFREFPPNQSNYKIPLIDISITLVSDNIETNSLKTLNKFIKIVLEYLEKNDVIIYYYCDTAPINIRQNRKENFSNQEFRFNLFLLMFNKMKDNTFYLQPVIISDDERGNHYTSLLSRTANIEKVQLVKSDLENFNK